MMLIGSWAGTCVNDSISKLTISPVSYDNFIFVTFCEKREELLLQDAAISR